MINTNFTGQEVIFTMIFLALFLVVFIYAFRKGLEHKARKLQKKIRKEIPSKRLDLNSRTKYTELSIEKYATTFFRLGLLIVTTAVFVAFNWTNSEVPTEKDAINIYSLEEIVEQIPNTYVKPKPKPKMPELKVEIVENIMEEDSIEWKGIDIFEDDPVFTDAVPIEKHEEIANSLPLPDTGEDDDLPIVFAQQMPRFPGCEEMNLTKSEKEACSKQKLLKYVYSKLNYPAIARETGIEGQVVIRFVVDRDGSIEDISIVRNIGGGCGEAAYKVVESMNNLPQKWTPGRQQGRAVKVLYTLPIKFKLEG